MARRDGYRECESPRESMKHRPATGNWCVGKREKDPSHVYERASVRNLRARYRNTRWHDHDA